jgi:probable HAF family extracellular repeat protein
MPRSRRRKKMRAKKSDCPIDLGVSMKSLLAILAAALPALAIHAAPAPKWTIQTLGNLGAGGTLAYAVNNHGEIVGYSRTTSGQIRAFHWADGVMTDAGALNPSFPSALYAINDQGIGLGTGNGGEVALWDDGAWAPIGRNGTPIALNKFGHVAGTSWNGNGSVAYLYRDGTFTDIPALVNYGPGFQSNALALNDRGMVVGAAALDWGVSHAYTWKDGVMTDLGTFGGTHSTATDVNNRGVVVGSASDGAVTRAFYYDGIMRPVCGLMVESDAQGINDRGAIVGNIGLQGYLCDNGVLTMLTDIPAVQAAGWRQIFPLDINDRGWIVGWGFKVGGSQNGEAFVLMPR